MISLKGLLLISILIGTPIARATQAACVIVPRAQAKQLLSALPAPFIGYADCTATHPGLRGLMMAQFKKLDDKALEDFVGRYARLTIPDAKRSYVVKKMVDASGERQVVIETVRPGGSAPEWHYVFTSRAANGDVLLYMHSAGAKESRGLREGLQAARRYLELAHQPSFAQADHK